MLRGICGQLFNNFSGQTIGPIFKNQAAFLDCFAPVDATKSLFRNARNYSSKSTN
jgi:hypothetical protein